MADGWSTTKFREAYALQLVEQVHVRNNKYTSSSCISQCNSEMIQVGISKDRDGEWRESQLRTDLLQICSPYLKLFQGQIPQSPEVYKTHF